MMTEDLQKVVTQSESLVSKLQELKPAKESVEWYAINNLKDFKNELVRAETLEDVKTACKRLSRFAVESLEWGSELMKNVEAICDSASRVTVK